MQLTREQWETLDKLSIKERVERLEELEDQIEQELSNMRLKEFNREMDEITETSDKQCIWALCIGMILVWAATWVLLTKAFM